MGEEFFGEQVAQRYDEDSAAMFESAVVDPAVDVLAEFAGDGGALEFAIGTGRIAVPLSARGVRVAGIDSSEAMLARLREKAGAADIHSVAGDMTTTRVDGEFALVYLVFNTIGNVTTQDGQVAVFENAAAHLQPGGRFVIEIGLPALQQLPVGTSIVPFHAGPDGLGFDVYDVVTQAMTSHHYTFRDGRAEHGHVDFRYAWPAEFDLMARIAGMRLEHRWQDWDRSPFTATSSGHVSVYRKP